MKTSWNGSIIAGSVLNNSATFGYTAFTFSNLQATSVTTPLQFEFNHGGFGSWALDDVSVTVSAVPEPSAIAFTILGLSGMLLLRQVRRVAV